MIRKIFALGLALVMLSGFGVSVNAGVSLSWDFKDYTSQGTTIPEGFTDRNGMLSGVEDGDSTKYQVISSAESDENTVLKLIKGTDTAIPASNLVLKSTDLAGITGKSSVFQIRVRQNMQKPGYDNCPVMLFYGTNAEAVKPFTVKSSGTNAIKGLGGFSASATIASSVAAGKWYTITLLSREYEDTGLHQFKSYVDGVFIEETEPAFSIVSGGELNEIRLNLEKQLSPGLENSYDDLRIYTPSALSASLNVTAGEKLPSSSSVAVNFSSPVDIATIGNITLKDNTNQNVAFVSAVSEDMLSVILTPVNSFDTNSSYQVSINGVSDLLGSSVTTQLGFETSSASQYAFSEKFDGYSGAGIPAGWTETYLTGYTLSGSGEGQNTYFNLTGVGGEGSMAKVYSNIDNASSGNFAINIKFKNNNASITDSALMYYTIGDFEQKIVWKHFGGNKTLSAIGEANTADMNALIASGGTLKSVTGGSWYNITIASEMVNDGGVTKQKLSYYVDGVFHGYRYLNDLSAAEAPARITKLTLAMTKLGAGNERTFSYDDLFVYNNRDLEIINGLQNDTPNVARDAKLDFEFSAPVLPSSLLNIKLYDGGGIEVPSTVSFADNTMTKINISPDNMLKSETVYSIRMENVKDVMGNSLTDEIDFSTARIEGRIFDEITAQLDTESGLISGSVKLVNNVDETLSGALFAAAYYNDVLVNTSIQRIGTLSKQSSEGYEFSIDTGSNDISYYKLKFFVWNDFMQCEISPAGEYIVGEPPSLFIIGDSTAASYSPDQQPRAGWGQMVPDYFDDSLNVVNRASAGTSSRTYYNTLWQSVLDEMQEGDFLVIQFGHNDMSADADRKTDLTLGMDVAPDDASGTYSYKWYMAQYIDMARDKGVTPIIATSIGRRIPSMNYTADPLLDAVNAAKDVASIKDAALIDMYTETVKLYKAYNTSDSRALFMVFDDGLYPYWGSEADNTHLRDYGAALAANIFKNLVNKSGLSLKAFTASKPKGNIKIFIKDMFAQNIAPAADGDGVWLPLEETLAALGSESYNYNESQGVISAMINGKPLVANIGEKKALVEGVETALTFAPLIKDTVPMVHSSFFGEALAFTVKWYPAINLLGILRGGEFAREVLTDNFGSFTASPEGNTAPEGYTLSRYVKDTAYLTAEVVNEDMGTSIKLVKNNTGDELYLYKNMEYYDSRSIEMKVRFDNKTATRELRLGIGGGTSNYIAGIRFNNDGTVFLPGIGAGAVTYEADTWYTIRVDITIEKQAEGNGISFVTYIDGNSYGSSYTEATPRGFLENFRIQLGGGVGSMYIDDVVVSPL